MLQELLQFVLDNNTGNFSPPPSLLDRSAFDILSVEAKAKIVYELSSCDGHGLPSLFTAGVNIAYYANNSGLETNQGIICEELGLDLVRLCSYLLVGELDDDVGALVSMYLQHIMYLCS